LMVWQLMVSVKVALVPVQPLLSVTVTTIGNVPFWIGVPESRPDGESEMPSGKVLAVVNDAVPTARGWVTGWLNGALTGPVVVGGFVTVMTWQLMVRVYVAPVPWQPLLSVTLTTMGNEPVCVGVPERTPAVESVRPAGSVLAVVNVAVPMAPLCVKIWLNAAPAVPVVTPGLLTVMVWQPMTSVYVELAPVLRLLSVTVTTIGNVPVCVGVPERTPPGESEMPVGKVLAVVNVAPPTAPLCVKVWVKAVPAVP